MDKSSAANSLFGEMQADIAIVVPPVPQAEAWSSIEKLYKEKELVGIYLSAHPLDDYSLILNKMCNTTCAEVGDRDLREQLASREDITFGGIVTKVTQRFSKRGEPFGVVTIEDFNGPGELALFGEEWGRWNGRLTEGCSVFVTAKCSKKYQNSQYYSLTIANIEYLQTVKDNRIERFTISINSDVINDVTVDDILSMITDTEGRTKLYINLHDEQSGANILLFARSQGIEVKKNLVDYITETQGMSYTVN